MQTGDQFRVLFVAHRCFATGNRCDRLRDALALFLAQRKCAAHDRDRVLPVRTEPHGLERPRSVGSRWRGALPAAPVEEA